jgi:hypothetical protein
MIGIKTPTSRINASAAASVLLLATWCAPSIASNGLDRLCDKTESPLIESNVPFKPSLSSHTEDTIDEPIGQDSPQLTALGAASAEQSGNKFDEAEDTTEQMQSSETPAVTTRLPGVSDTAASGFRRQMLRTDI